MNQKGRKTRNTKVLSVANMKGGCGKDTVSILLATALANEGYLVSIVDCDSQGTLESIASIDAEVNGESIVSIYSKDANEVTKWLSENADRFDFVFLNIPRITFGGKEHEVAELLFFCEGVLVPVLGSLADVASTKNFLPVLEQVKEWRIKNGYGFRLHGFINRHNRRSDNEQAKKHLSAFGLSMFDAHLSDVKLFSFPSLAVSVLNSAEGVKRFGGFFSEFKKKYKVK